tara:strand:+ start:1238 stop:1666 length:429 start_codon:yes stop_codon:yes gene_type:complete
MKSLLPSILTARAFTASNGELAWKRQDLEEVVSAYAELGYAVEAFEVWVVNDKGQWNGFFPMRDGSEHICVYDVAARRGEADSEFARRCASEITEKVKEIDIESEIDPKCLPWVRYNLYVDEEYIESEQDRGAIALPRAAHD